MNYQYIFNHPLIQDLPNIAAKYGVFGKLIRYKTPEKGLYFVMSVEDDIPDDFDPIKVNAQHITMPYVLYTHEFVFPLCAFDLKPNLVRGIDMIINRCKQIEMFKKAFRNEPIPKVISGVTFQAIVDAYLSAHAGIADPSARGVFQEILDQFKKEAVDYDTKRTKFDEYLHSIHYQPYRSKARNYINFLFHRNKQIHTVEDLAANCQINSINCENYEFEQFQKEVKKYPHLHYAYKKGVEFHQVLPNLKTDDENQKPREIIYHNVKLFYPQAQKQEILQVFHKIDVEPLHCRTIAELEAMGDISIVEITESSLYGIAEMLDFHKIPFAIDDGTYRLFDIGLFHLIIPSTKTEHVEEIIDFLLQEATRSHYNDDIYSSLPIEPTDVFHSGLTRRKRANSLAEQAINLSKKTSTNKEYGQQGPEIQMDIHDFKGTIH